MYSNPRAHRVGRLLAFLIEPFILALAYAHIPLDIAYAIRRDRRACVHTREYIDYRCLTSVFPLRTAYLCEVGLPFFKFEKIIRVLCILRRVRELSINFRKNYVI